jgi:2-oxoglutarate dehydrogenase E2 component (dihydrolipoamide succinyltransferase)
VVPVIRHAEKMSFAELEQAIVDYVAKIKENRLELADLEGGTFTISNGGVLRFAAEHTHSQHAPERHSGHAQNRKAAGGGGRRVVIRPMMYVALSYDHRIVDGKGAVTFLKRVKEFIENPERMMMEV